MRIWFLGEDGNADLLLSFAFIPARYSIAQIYDYLPAAIYWTPVSYMMLHADWSHVLMNSVWMLVFGAVVAKRVGAARFFTICILGSLGGAGLHYTFHANDFIPVIGASAAVSACTGAAVRFAFPQGRRFGLDVSGSKRLGILQSITNPQAFAFIAIWFGINFLFGAGIVNIAGEGQSIAWEAHIGGFLAGFLLFSLFDTEPENELAQLD